MKDLGYGSMDNSFHVIMLEDMDDSDKRAYLKKLYQQDPEKYFAWKEWCIRLDQLPDIFGTYENPIPFDESKL